MKLSFKLLIFWLLLGFGSICPAAKPSLKSIKHIIVIYAENRSFDNLYGLFPGANGIQQATPEQTTQIDHDGKPFKELPPVWHWEKGQPPLYAHLPNKPFRIDSTPMNLPLSVRTRDLVHLFYQNQEQINGGKNNRFAAISDAGGLTMGYYDGAQLPMWQWAKDYVLADNFYMGAFGGSFLNHQWLVCACTPYLANALQDQKIALDSRGLLQRKPDSPKSAMQGPPEFVAGHKPLTPDGYVIAPMQPPYQPSKIPPTPGGDRRFANPAEKPLEPQTGKTIGDTLSAKNISWAWYAGGWDAALVEAQDRKTGSPTKVIYTPPGTINFQTHHQPFNYYARFAPGTKARRKHLKDAEAFFKGIRQGKLPRVSFYKPVGILNQHPGYTNVLNGDRHIAELLEAIKNSPLWKNTAVIVTYDENGGFWDHAPPPKGDRWGPGTRVPTIIVSPFAKRHFIDHTVYDTTSILKFITRRFGLAPLKGVRANAGDLSNAFAF
jgi:acid phosphatase